MLTRIPEWAGGWSPGFLGHMSAGGRKGRNSRPFQILSQECGFLTGLQIKYRFGSRRSQESISLAFDFPRIRIPAWT